MRKVLRTKIGRKVFTVPSARVATIILRRTLGKLRIPCVHKVVKSGVDRQVGQESGMVGLVFGNVGVGWRGARRYLLVRRNFVCLGGK